MFEYTNVNSSLCVRPSSRHVTPTLQATGRLVNAAMGVSSVTFHVAGDRCVFQVAAARRAHASRTRCEDFEGDSEEKKISTSRLLGGRAESVIVQLVYHHVRHAGAATGRDGFCCS